VTDPHPTLPPDDVPPGEGGAAPGSSPWTGVPMSRLWWFSGPTLIVLVIALIVVLSMPMPYYTFSPGQARAVEPLVTIRARKGGPVPDVDRADRRVLFVTVSSAQPAGIGALFDLFDDTVDLVPEDAVTGGQSRKQNQKFNLQLMTDSKDRATKVALERAGYRVPTRTTGAVVTDADPSFPVAKVVTPGATVVEADGTKITSADDLVEVIRAKRPGDSVRLVLEPFEPGPRVTVSPTIAAREGAPDAPVLGVTLEDRPEYEFPIIVEIDSLNVGGPSAGLAFTLAILDRLTPGRLMGPTPVAVTGTIELDGSVGPVGGVKQKTEAAVRAGATAFIVPPDELVDARKAARGRLEVRVASTLDQALTVLRDLGGDPLPARPRSGGTGSGG
jgi:PDZ domain-containing protein